MSFNFIRRFFYEIHLWLGIITGIIVILICFSGMTLIFRDDIQRLANREKYYISVPKDGTKLSVDEILKRIESENPGKMISSVTIPDKANRTITVSLASPMPEGGRQFGGERGQRPEGREDRRQFGGERGQRPEGRERPEGSRTKSGEPSEGRMNGEQNQTASTEGGESRPGNPNQRGGGQQGGRGTQPSGSGRGGEMLYINPYTGQTVAKGGGFMGGGSARSGSGSSLDRFFMSMQQLHRNLWISYRIESLGSRSSLGGLIVGITTIIFVIIILSGFVLWLPRTWKAFTKWKSWKIGFFIRFRKGFWHFVYDIHNTVGFYLLLPMLILALTGLCWSFSWYRTAASSVLGDQIFKQRMQRPERIEPVDASAQPLSIGEMIERQNKLTPRVGEMMISVPQDRETAMVIQKGRTGFFALSIKDKTQWDRFRGTVIPVEHFGKQVEVERFADKPFGAKIAAAVRTIHFGDVTGLSSKIFFFIVCFFATTFPITGVMLWCRKLYLKRKIRKLALQREAAV